MSAAVIAFPEPPSNGLTRGQAKYLRDSAADCRQMAERLRLSLLGGADAFDAVLRKRRLTPSDWNLIREHLGNRGYDQFMEL